MKVWVVSRGDDYYSENIGVHQVESYAYDQANAEMQLGEWGAPYTHEGKGAPDVPYIKAVTFLRGGDFVSIEEFEVKY